MQDLQTPPDTVAVRKNLLRHRQEILEFKQAYAESIDDDTPTFDVLRAHRPSSAAFTSPDVTKTVHVESENDLSTNLLDLILYKNPPLTFLSILSGSFLFTTTRFIISGPHQLTFLSGLCYMMLFKLAFNFARTVFAKNPSAVNWTGSTLVCKAIESATNAINYLAALHDRYLSAQDPNLTLKVGVSLYGVAFIGHVFSIWTLCSIAFLFAFTVPYLVKNNWEVVTDVYNALSIAVAARYKALGLTRKQQAGGVFLLLSVIWMRSSWASRLVGVFIAALGVRCTLKPAEMAVIRQRAAPLSMSVKKKALRLSMVASDFAVRTLGSKSPYQRR